MTWWTRVAKALGGVATVSAVAWSAGQVIAASEQRIIEREALKVAEVVALQAIAARTVFDRTADEDRLNEFLKGIGEQSRRLSGDGYSYRWLPAKSPATLDAWEREALQRVAHPSSSDGHAGVCWKLGTYAGRPTLRYVRAVDDGGLEVFVPVEQATAFAAVQSRTTRTLVAALSAVGLALMSILALRSAGQHRRLARRYEQLAKVDALTGLPNRLAVDQIMQERLAAARASGRAVGVMFVDLDNFKNINDSLGHLAGDLVLRSVASRLSSVLRSADVVARYSGDEFVVLVDGASEVRHLSAVATKLIQAVAPVMSVHDHDIFVTLSIGIATSPRDGTDASTVLKHADAAMYRAKEKGRNGFEFFALEMNHSALERLRMNSSLRHALRRNEFLVYYQPKADARGQRVVGFEALVRWQHPENGLLSPAHFIPHAESTGAIEQLGEWVLDAALAQLRQWREARGFDGTMAVNLSMRQLYNAKLPQVVANALATHRVAPEMLELEVTESMVSVNPEVAARTLNEIHRLGVSIALDDFGTGQSSLSNLLRFPIRTLKVDRTFTKDVLERTDTRSVVRAMMALARSLNMRIVAEGVETEEQRRFFQHEGCDEIQGYLVGWPMPAEEAAVFAFSPRPELVACSA